MGQTRLTCAPILTEAGSLLQRGGGTPTVLLKALRTGILNANFEVHAEVAALEAVMDRYSDVPMSLADACLVLLSERHQDCRVLTVWDGRAINQSPVSKSQVTGSAIPATRSADSHATL